ncbi:BP74-related protein [Bdellovibrio sp. BCCA]|uniref:BP74-related protein n=1 Tax=Bdellovibrio sp. BCCA TaxID=3136281 RepID=UPI0030F21039
MDFSIKTTLGISSFVLLTSLSAQASDVVYVPAYCAPQALTVFVTNKTSEPQRLWTQVRFDGELQELHHDIDAKSQIKIAGTQFLPSQMGFSIKSWTKNSLQITTRCDESLSIPLSDLTSPQVSHWLPSNVKSVKVHLLNLFLKSNSVKLQAFNKAGSVIGEKEVLIEKYYDTSSFKWTLPENAARIEVVGQERLHSLMFYDQFGEEKLSPAVALKPVSFSLDDQKTYFLVSTKDARPEESFVIALKDDQQIATAREQIKNPALEKIIVAGIELGNGGFNRAFKSRDKSPYSWSVNRVDAFADFAHIDCDGSPDLTEERLEQKLNEGGRICFWRYRIIKELSASEVASGTLKP